MECATCGRTIRFDSKTGFCRKHVGEGQPVPLVGEAVMLIQESDFSELVSQVFDRPYRLQQQGEMMAQDSCRVFTIPEDFRSEMNYDGVEENITAWLDAEPDDVEDHVRQMDGTWANFKRPMSDFQEELWWERENYPDFTDVSYALAHRGLLAPGKYVMQCWW